MRGKLAESIGAIALVVTACASNHRVSPWGALDAPPLGAYVAAPDLDAQLSSIDVETRHLGLVPYVELARELPGRGGPAVIRGYRGHDALGRRTYAVRAATARGVVMALGPLDEQASRDEATELVPSLLGRAGEGAGAFQSGTDFNGDGALDVIVRNHRGHLAIWRVTAIGSSRYSVVLEDEPTFALDVDGDGRPDLASRSLVPAADPIAPALDDVATFDGAAYSNATQAARDHHARRALALGSPTTRIRGAADPSRREADPPLTPPDHVRLRRALERAWHTILSGQPREPALAALDREPVPANLRASFDLHRARIARAGRET